jgi:excisionase family DNA binding protein
VNVSERIRQLMAALPSDGAAVVLTRRDLAALVEDSPSPPAHTRDLSVEDVAEEVGRAPSTVRGWLIAGELQGYKLNRRDWRVTRKSLREYLEAQAQPPDPEPSGEAVDIGAWRKVQ